MKILIADDHSIVREGLKQYVKTLDEVKLIDEAVDGNDAWIKIKDGDYDLVILDVSMPGMSGLDVLQKIKERNLPTRVLILSVHPQEQYAFHAFKLGASGYLSKDSASEELTLAIKKIKSGGRYTGRGEGAGRPAVEVVGIDLCRREDEDVGGEGGRRGRRPISTSGCPYGRWRIRIRLAAWRRRAGFVAAADQRWASWRSAAQEPDERRRPSPDQSGPQGRVPG